MNITGIITEYNPLHNGHIYHLNKSISKSKADATVCVMSGNFVQRGFPAIIDKWTRTKFALESGVDLVIELPVYYATSSAEFFAKGSVSTLDSLNVVNSLCFGSECGNINTLYHISKILAHEPEVYKKNLQDYLKDGMSFPSARSKALIQYISKSTNFSRFSSHSELTEILSSSNNILGLEYCKSLIKLNSSITPLTITRVGSNYNDTEITTEFSSATSIRTNMSNAFDLEILKSCLPRNVFNCISELKRSKYDFTNGAQMFNYIKHKLFINKNVVKALPDYEEGLENKFIKAFSSTSTLNDAIEQIKSKRYTYTRINRMITHLFLGFDSVNYGLLRNSTPSYIRVLGFSSKGRQILKLVKERSDIPIITTVKKNHSNLLSHDISATNLYSLLNNNINYNDDFYRKPVIYDR